MPTPEKPYDELIARLEEGKQTVRARCEELAQRCDALASAMSKENASATRNTRILLITIGVAIAALLTVTVASVASDPEDNRPISAER